MAETCLIREWGGRQRIFLWNVDGDLRPTSLHGVTSGFVKRFLFSKEMIVYERNDKWFVYFLGKSVPLESIGEIAADNFGMLLKLNMIIGCNTFSFFDLVPLDFFARKFDPTYDTLDSELVFGRWLVSLHKKK